MAGSQQLTQHAQSKLLQCACIADTTHACDLTANGCWCCASDIDLNYEDVEEGCDVEMKACKLKLFSLRYPS